MNYKLNIYKPHEQDIIRNLSIKLRDIFDQVRVLNLIRSGVSLIDLDLELKKLIKEYGATLLYRDGRGVMGINVNNCIAHAHDYSDYKLKSGDIVSLDIVITDGTYHADRTETYYTTVTHPIVNHAYTVLELTKTAVIEVVWNKGTVGDLRRLAYRYTKEFLESLPYPYDKYKVLGSLCGHGIGYELHEMPRIIVGEVPCHYSEGIQIVPGMCFTIEPIVVETSAGIYQLSKEYGYGIYTKDNSLSAYYERMVIVGNRELDII